MENEARILGFNDITYPCLIHGLQGSGASQFTISLAAHLANQGKEILYFCAFPPGLEKLLEDTDKDKQTNLVTAEPGDERDLIHKLDRYGEAVSCVIIKNFETLSIATQDNIYKYRNLVLSGDMNSVEGIGIKPDTIIMFSPTENKEISVELPILEKYTGFLANKDQSGKIRLPI